jgi:hypothetical protein
MLVTMKEVQVAQERYGDFRKYAQHYGTMRCEQKPRQDGGWQALRTTLASWGQRVRPASKIGAATAGIPEGSR